MGRINTHIMKVIDIFNDKEKELDFSMFESSNSNVPILYTSNNLSSMLSGICHPSGLFR